jgi:virginiamycin B lyase
MGGERNKAGRSKYWGLGLGLALWCAGLVSVAGATAPITEFPLPTPNMRPTGITAGPDGALWFTEMFGNKIGRITPAGTITEFPLPTPSSGPDSITAGPDGALWFTEFTGNKIGRITPAGTITEFALPRANSAPYGITAGPDGALWFTELGGTIGRITPAGTITEFALPTPNSAPIGITAGPDGALWFTEQNANKIGRITPAGTITEFALPTPNSAPNGITAGPDGALWFTENAANKIGRITTAGTITEFALPRANSCPSTITAGPDGALWFIELCGTIGRITTSGAIFEVPLPTPSSGPDSITAGPDGAVWFTEQNANKIGRIEPDLAGIAAVSLSGSVLHMDQTITYEAILTPGPTPTPVDIYLGAVLPDGVTFASFIEVSPGVISFAVGPSPIPFQANVTLRQAVIPFSYTFNGFEPVGAYFMYAHLVIAGSDPLVPANQLSVAVKSFQFLSDVCLSVSVSGSGSVTSSPLGNGGSGCFAYFAPGTTVTLTAQGQGSTFAGWGGECASAGTHATCTLLMTTNKHVGASFSTTGPSGYVSPYACVFGLCHIKLGFNFPPFRIF